MWSNRNAPALLVGKQNSFASLEDSFLENRNEPFLAHDSAIIAAQVFTWESPKNLSAQSNLRKDVSSNFIHNCPNLEAIRMSLAGEWINKLWYIQTMEYYWVLKGNELSSHGMEEP